MIGNYMINKSKNQSKDHCRGQVKLAIDFGTQQ